MTKKRDNSIFNYALLADEKRIAIIAHTGDIHRKLEAITANIIDIGRSLYEVKQLLEHGQYTDWLRREFDWSDRSAQRFVNVYLAADNVTDLGANLDKFSKTAIYILTAPGAPKGALKTAVKRAKRGEVITGHIANELCGKSSHRPTLPTDPNWRETAYQANNYLMPLVDDQTLYETFIRLVKAAYPKLHNGVR